MEGIMLKYSEFYLIKGYRCHEHLSETSLQRNLLKLFNELIDLYFLFKNYQENLCCAVTQILNLSL